jgi:hypothetical protein
LPGVQVVTHPEFIFAAMGLPGIFKLLRELGSTVDFLNEMRGKVVGIDLYTWLHKDLVGLGHGPGNDQMEEVVKCTLARARRLAQAGIQAVFCVEGDLLPGYNTKWHLF